MQKIKLTSLLLILFIAFFSSCSQDDAPVEAREDAQDLSGFNSDEIRAARVVASAADLPDCSEELENFLFYIESEEEFQVCRELEYHPIDLRGAAGVDGADGSSCEAESIAEGVVITCAGVLVDTLANGVDGQNGLNGTDGSSCSVIDNQNGTYTLACDDGSSIILHDGADGSDGTDGAMGLQGADGESCTGVVVSGGIEITCGAVVGVLTNGVDGQDGLNGADGSSCSVIENGTGVYEMDCTDGTSVSWSDGADGENGADGSSCTGNLVSEGIELICGGVVVGTLLHGVDGQDGESCSAESISEGIVVSCGGVVVDTLLHGDPASADGYCTISVDENTSVQTMNCPEGEGIILNDIDNDNVVDAVDNCPAISNADQADADADGLGDLCDTDIDGDGVDNEIDNCPAISNADQADDDSNGVGDVCDGIFTDSRDGQEYATVTIGNQVWMAENLRYLPQVDHEDNGSEDVADGKYYYVYDYVPSGASEAEQVANAKATTNYQSYGVLYNWNAAMDASASSATNPSGVQGVCPDGWHLPSDAEWTELSDFVDLDNDGDASLKATSGWYNDGNGLDTYGFSALPGGFRDLNGNFYNVGYHGFWWSATEGSSSSAYYRYLLYSSGSMVRGYDYKYLGFSVRCLQDQP
jgi:uncharacterized protein (TIGR02145 family)